MGGVDGLGDVDGVGRVGGVGEVGGEDGVGEVCEVDRVGGVGEAGEVDGVSRMGRMGGVLGDFWISLGENFGGFWIWWVHFGGILVVCELGEWVWSDHLN